MTSITKTFKVSTTANNPQFGDTAGGVDDDTDQRTTATTEGTLAVGVGSGKDDATKSAFFVFGDRGDDSISSGIGIPASAIIEDAFITVVNDTAVETGLFNADVAILAPANFEENKGFNIGWIKTLGRNRGGSVDIYVTVSGDNDTELLFEGGSTPTTSNNTFTNIPGQPTSAGMLFNLSITGTVSHMGFRVDGQGGSVATDWDTWGELHSFRKQAFQSPTESLERGGVADFLARTESLSQQYLVASGSIFEEVQYPMLEDVTLSGGGDNFYFFSFHMTDKFDTPGRTGTVRIGLAPENFAAFVGPSFSGIEADASYTGFTETNYKFTRDLPFLFELDGSTPIHTPFGSILSIPVQAFNTVPGEENITGLAQIFQEWVDDESYDRRQSVGITIGPGDAAAGDQRVFDATTSSGSDFDPTLTITYRPRRVDIN